MLKDRHGNKRMSFSGHVQAHCAMESEEKAFEKLIYILQGKGWREVSLLVFSDNMNMVRAISKNHKGLKSKDFISVEIQHTNRALNFETNSLAKDGAKPDSLVVSWV